MRRCDRRAAGAPPWRERERRAGRRAHCRPRHLAEDRRRHARRNGRVPRRPASDSRQPSRGRGVPGGHERLPGAGAARVRHGAHARIRLDLRALRRHRPRDDRVPARPWWDEGLLPPHRLRAGRHAIAWSRSTCPGSASPTSRSARPTTRPGSPAPHSRRWTRSASSARTSPATAWADAWRSRRASMDPERTGGLVLLSPALAWLRDAPLGADAAAASAGARAAPARAAPGGRGDGPAARAGRQRRLDRGRRGRVPARVPHAARARRVLCRGAQHLPGRAARRERVLDPARDASARLAVRLGPQGHARADRLHEARREGAAEGTHVELECGHVPQVERPRETHAAIRKFLAGTTSG